MMAIIMILITLLVVAVPVTLFVIAVRGVSDWSYRRSLPVLQVRGRIVDKSMDVFNDGIYSYGKYPRVPMTYTTYYVTVETEYGQRLTFAMGADISGQLVVGDVGLVRYKGDRLLDFQRELPAPQDSYHPPVRYY